MFKNWFSKLKDMEIDPASLDIPIERRIIRTSSTVEKRVVTQEENERLASEMGGSNQSPFGMQPPPLLSVLAGKTILNARISDSGFVLFLNDTNWIAFYLEGPEMRWRMGQGELPNEVQTLINSPNNSYSSGELGQASQAVGKRIIGITSTSTSVTKFTSNIAYAAFVNKTGGLPVPPSAFSLCFTDKTALKMSLSQNDPPSLVVSWEENRLSPA